MYKALHLPTKVGAFYQFMDFNRIFVKENAVFIDAFDFLIIPAEEISKDNFPDLNYFLGELKRKKLTIIPPEISAHKSLNLFTLIWILGNFAFFIFEVC